MKIPLLALVSLQNVFLQNSAKAACAPDPLEFSETIGMQVEKVGSVPAANTDEWTYNMNAADSFDEYPIYFIDQKEGLVFSYDEDGTVSKVFDMTESAIPAGMTLDWTWGGATQEKRVQQLSQGARKGEVFVVMMSSTLPDGWDKADAELPAAGAFPGWTCTANPLGDPEFVRDLYRIGEIPSCFDSGAGAVGFTVYQVFVKYSIDEDGSLIDPEPFFVLENQMAPGHFGGGMATVDKGKILWSVGDCLPFGTTGLYAPQLDSEHCGKILLIDPENGEYEVAAKGVRNSQQFRVIEQEGRRRGLKTGKKGEEKKGDKLLVFMDIGGVTAEEVNAKSLDAILDTKEIENFGWGRSIEDGNAREGTFYLSPGSPGTLGTDPPCEGDAPIPEEGYEQPWIQFGRTENDFFYAISSFVVGSSSFTDLALIWTEFNTGLVLGTTDAFVDGAAPAQSYKIKLYDTDGNYLENGFNDLVKEELGELEYYRGDPRVFHYPDGTAGVFIERTGVFYKLTEILL
mmetsp:Transcript_10898/g.16763  ORF Transcript_10898/g.16763 Transcript_10898/m.16763 type:complete len:514 (-) Transcript_10898:225-1766(-)|eukprot:CAMPEP_0178931198 /NCGR_PEP_ID=MMETSP0786-20121207/21763_1 /TAXON_ID=186022 /ORGANISM="Thalassionema frauenfeldii, Strain CCMP 1798" /LENGTH=513 /DNA_ID=CAMNT_0020608021 /DNA_START=21 /DNA_END=1562 /DNA_ORIENTATION=-